MVVSPVKVRNLPTTFASSLTQGATTRNMPVQEIVLAVAPEEVGLLAEAMDMKYQITCVVRSGRPAPAVSPEAHPRRAAPRRAERLRSWPLPARQFRAKMARPPWTRLHRRPEEQKPSTPRRAKRRPRSGRRWTSRPDWIPRPGRAGRKSSSGISGNSWSSTDRGTAQPWRRQPTDRARPLRRRRRGPCRLTLRRRARNKLCMGRNRHPFGDMHDLALTPSPPAPLPGGEGRDAPATCWCCS